MVNKLKCVIVDDEPLAREIIEKYVAVIDYLELICVAENALELNQILESQKIDLIFLDVQMPFMTGLDFLKVKTNLPMVIITTAYPNYALEGFQFDVMDYLLKPITFNRFFKAVSKAFEYHNLKQKPSENDSKTDEDAYFFVKCEHKYHKIFTAEILYIESHQNYIVIHTETKKHMSLMPLKTIEENLNSKEFMRVHKSFLVSISKIQTLENHEIILLHDHKIPISRSFRKIVQEKVLKNKILRKNN